MSDADPGLPDIAAAAVIHPGDHVLIGLRDATISREQLDQARASLRHRFPDVEFTFLGGVAALAVQRA